MSDRVSLKLFLTLTCVFPSRLKLSFIFRVKFSERDERERKRTQHNIHLSEDWHWNVNGENVDSDLIIRQTKERHETMFWRKHNLFLMLMPSLDTREFYWISGKGRMEKDFQEICKVLWIIPLKTFNKLFHKIISKTEIKIICLKDNQLSNLNSIFKLILPK